MILVKKLQSDLPTLGFTKCQMDLVSQSYMTAQSDAYGSEWTARVLNGFVVTESESDDPQLIANLRNPLYESGRLLISKRQKLNQRKMRRLRVKAIAGQRFLSKRTSKRISKIWQSVITLERLLKILCLSTVLALMPGAIWGCSPLTAILVSHKKSPMNAFAFICRRYTNVISHMEQ